MPCETCRGSTSQARWTIQILPWERKSRSTSLSRSVNRVRFIIRVIALRISCLFPFFIYNKFIFVDFSQCNVYLRSRRRRSRTSSCQTQWQVQKNNNNNKWKINRQTVSGCQDKIGQVEHRFTCGNRLNDWGWNRWQRGIRGKVETDGNQTMSFSSVRRWISCSFAILKEMSKRQVALRISGLVRRRLIVADLCTKNPCAL